MESLLSGLQGIIEEQVGPNPHGGLFQKADELEELEDRPLGDQMNGTLKRERSLISLQYVFS